MAPVLGKPAAGPLALVTAASRDATPRRPLPPEQAPCAAAAFHPQSADDEGRMAADLAALRCPRILNALTQ